VVKKLSGDKLKILSHSTPKRDMSKAYSSNKGAMAMGINRATNSSISEFGIADL
jgi:hypothetical protein